MISIQKIIHPFKRLTKKIKLLYQYFIIGSCLKPEQRGLNKLNNRKLGYGIIWGDES